MKRLFMIFISTLMLITTQVNAQSLNRFFNKYDGDSQFESVSVGRFLFSLALISGNLKADEKELLASLRRIKVLTSKDKLDPEFTARMMHDLNKVIQRGDFENLLEVRDKGERVSIYVRKIKDFYTDLLITVREADEVNFIWINGKLSPEIISKLQNENKLTGLPVNINL